MALGNYSGVRFSIITPVRNAVATIERTLNSVAQQHVASEHLVLDAASTDGTCELIEAHRETLAYYRSHPDGGIAAAFNEGIRRARGEYVLFLNADDYLLPNALELVQARLVEAEGLPDIVYGDVMIEDGELRYLERSSLDSLRNYMSLHHPSMFFARSIFERIGAYDEAFTLAMDSELLHRAVAANCSFAQIERPLAVMSRGGLSDVQHWQALKQYQRSLRQHGLSSLPRSLAYLVRQYLVHSALKVPAIKRWRVSRRVVQTPADGSVDR